MTRFGPLVVLLPIVAGCADAGSPTTPGQMPAAIASPSVTEPIPSLEGRPFTVSGRVTDERGIAIPQVDVTMRHYLNGRVYAPSVSTDMSGAYRIEFTSTPYRLGGDSATARAEIIADGYEWFWRDVVVTGEHLVENFSLRRRKQIAAGEAIVLSLTAQNGSCLGWLRGPCDRVRVVARAAGTLTIVATPRPASALSPEIQVCCVDGDERYGNPVTIPVTAGFEADVEVGQPHRQGYTSELVEVRTVFEPR